MATSQVFKIFVYGTLKRGQPNNFLLTNRDNGIARFLGEGKTSEKYPLVIATRYNIPFLLNSPNTGNHIVGEVYEVDEKMLARLDELEDYPDFYDRAIREINVAEGQSEQCWLYYLNRFPEKLLSLPHLAEYKDTPEKSYQERCKRVKNILAKDDLDYN